jgi:NADH-quinone oxidoreductase subunit N
MISFSNLDLTSFIPEITLTAGLLVLIIRELVRKERSALGIGAGSMVLLTGLIFLALRVGVRPGEQLFGALVDDGVAVFFKVFFSLAVGLSISICLFTFKREGEPYLLLLASVLGMFLLGGANDIITLVVAIELVSIPSYILAGYNRRDPKSAEASLKYVLYGAVSTGVMIYGFSLLYGLTGATSIPEMAQALSGGNFSELVYLLAVTLIMAGLGYKIAMVPFHFWCPDVYTGAPTPVTAFLSVAPKAAGFAILVRFFFTGLSQARPESVWSTFASINWMPILMVLSIVTMTFGNIAALRQENMKRLLAYSSIAQAGYILMGAVVLTAEGLQAVLVYLITYLFMNLGAFMIVIEIYNRTGSFELKDYRGFYRRSPFLSVSMSIFLLSLMGIPPLAGFFGKLYVFAAAVNRDLAWFAVIGALNSVVAVYYYARVMKTMVIDDGEETSPVRASWDSAALIWVMLIPTVGLMLFWDQVQRITLGSVGLFLGN